MSTEIWKVFKKTTKAEWQVSNLGRIKKNGELYTPYFRGGIPNNRYLCLSTNKPLGGYIHRIVAAQFIPNPENKETVNHIDGDKTNNAVSNLEWATYLENSRHAWKNGLMSTVGKYNPNKVKNKSISKKKSYINVQKNLIKLLYEQGLTQSQISRQIGISRQLVRSRLLNMKLL